MKLRFNSLITLFISVLLLTGCTLTINLGGGDKDEEGTSDLVNVQDSATDTNIEENTNEKEADVSAEENQATTKFGKVYTSEELDYKLTVPDKWLDYGYYVEFKYDNGRDGGPSTGTGSPEVWEDIYYADFEDWNKFELLRVGSSPKPIFDDAINMYKTLSEMCIEKRADPTVLPSEYCYFDGLFEPYYAKLGTDVIFYETPTVGKNAGYVYYSYRNWQDAPNEFIKDGQPLPDLKTDFEVVPK